MPHKLAVIIRGTMGSGKTTIIDELRKLVGYDSSERICLDEWWGKGQFRELEGIYSDVEKVSKPVVFVELAYGCDGRPTKQPKEWTNILHKKGYDIYSFRLRVSKDTAIKRVEGRKNMWKSEHACEWYDGYENENSRYYSDINNFSKIIGTEEFIIENEIHSPKEVAESINKYLPI